MWRPSARALCAYTALAHEGGFDLGAYPAIRAWMEWFEDHPRHILIADRPSD